MAIKTVGVLGCGLMGSGITQASAQAGFPTGVVEATPARPDGGLDGLKKTREGLVAKAKIEAKDRDAILGCITGTTRLEELKACDLVVEAITENQPLKNETFPKLEGVCPPHP